MMLFAIILLGIIIISGAIFLWTELSIMGDRVRWLEDRLNQLEKDSIKIKFKKETV